jgi:hypothetical protein
VFAALTVTAALLNGFLQHDMLYCLLPVHAVVCILVAGTVPCIVATSFDCCEFSLLLRWHEYCLY